MFKFKKKIAKKKEVELVHVKTQKQVIDIFIKSLKFEDWKIESKTWIAKN